MPFADCSGNFAPVTPAQLCEGFNKCGDMQLNSANMNGVIRWLESLAGAAGDPGAVAAALAGDNAAREALAAALAADPEAIAAIYAALPQATVADLLTPSSSADKIVTDDVLRAALGTQQDRMIDIARNGAAITGRSLDGAGPGVGGAVYAGTEPGVVGEANSAATGPAVLGRKIGTGNGSAVLAQKTSTGNGSAIGAVTYSGLGPAGEFTSDGSADGNTLVAHHQSTLPGNALFAEKWSDTSGAAILAMVRPTVTVDSPAVNVISEGGGNSPPVVVENNTTGNGSGVLSKVGFTAFGGGPATGLGASFYGINGPNGSRNAVGQFDLSGANTTWGVSTNGAIFTAGGVTTSDKRLKRDIVQIDGARAAELATKVRFYTFQKLKDPASIVRIQNEMQARAKAQLSDLEQQLAGAIAVEEAAALAEKAAKEAAKAAKAAEKNGDATTIVAVPVAKSAPAMSSDDIRARIEHCKKECEITLDVSDEALSIGRQAGVIAQDLQATLVDFPEYAFLVKLSDPADQESVLVVDYQSLDAIMTAAIQHKLFSV